MKRREFLIRLGEMGLLGASVSLSGCISSGTGTSNSELTDTTATVSGTESTTTATANPTTAATTASSLARTCPKGKSCTSPECPQWSDLNGNRMCDRGYRET